MNKIFSYFYSITNLVITKCSIFSQFIHWIIMRTKYCLLRCPSDELDSFLNQRQRRIVYNDQSGQIGYISDIDWSKWSEWSGMRTELKLINI